MGKEVIMLASKYNPKKQVFPAYVSEKLDGVAADMFVAPAGPDMFREGITMLVQSRQGELIPSVQDQAMELLKLLGKYAEVGMHFIGELYIPNADFKDISGKVRRQSEKAEDIQFYIYDFYQEGHEDIDYINRMASLHDLVEKQTDRIKLIPLTKVDSVEELELYKKALFKNKPDAEGIMIRQMSGKGSDYQIGKRPSGMAKDKLVETHDLKLVGIEEAIDAKTGEGNGMAGRLVVEYKGKQIGCGPGKLVYGERIHMYLYPEEYIGKTIEVAAMPDASYDALREPRFIRFRPDKD